MCHLLQIRKILILSENFGQHNSTILYRLRYILCIKIQFLDSHKFTDIKKEIDIKFETLRSYDGEQSILDMEASQTSAPDHSMDSHDENDQGMHTMLITPDMMGMMPGSGPHGLGMNYFYLSI